MKMNMPSKSCSSAYSSEESETSSSPSRRRRRISSPRDTQKTKLSKTVSKWERLHVQHHLKIQYASRYIEEPLDLFAMVARDVSPLSKEQDEYIDFVNKYLSFSMPLTSFHHQSKIVEDALDTCENEIKELEERDKSWWVLKLKVFVAGIRALFEDVKDYRRKNQPFEDFCTSFVGVFADLCCLRVQYCKRVRHVVMENLKDIKQVTSEPDIRLFKCGLNHEFSKVMVSVVQVIPDLTYNPVIPSGKTKKRRKTFRERSRRSGFISENVLSKYSTSSMETLASGDTEELSIEVDLNDRVLGQHAGELLLDLHNKHKGDEKLHSEDEVRKNLTMTGMIVNGTRVFFTLLEMTRKHYQKLKDYEDLDENDKAIIYYSNPKDILMEPERRTLIKDFMSLNNIE
ncbi:uncharacterized protein LOC127725545 [Mytilus californianus]|uniref:uncharacterized protein LOC127725545 n=1 Tax=Mytilus californianus TaxID=6549 RepID=UPI002247AB59|nr:uncharacterized protein LOC127725545 [Mytilus californianus]